MANGSTALLCGMLGIMYFIRPTLYRDVEERYE